MTVRTNLVQNPKFENDSNYWSLDADFTLNAGTGGALAGGYVNQSSSGGFANFTTVNDSNGYPVSTSTDYILSFYFRMNSLSGNAPQVQINGSSAFGTTLAFTSLYDSGGNWARVSIAFNSGAHTLVYFRLLNNGGTVDADYSNFLLEEGSDLQGWFDGDSVQTGYSYAWSGTADASSSTETALFTVTDKTFTVDGIVQALGNTKEFTVDAIISDPADDTPPEFIIYELMDEEPAGIQLGDASYSTGYVQLTDAVNNQDGQLEFQKTLPTNYIIEADFSADGDAEANYVYWGCSATQEAEETDNGGYVVAWDEAEQVLELFFAGVSLVSVAIPFAITDGVQRSLKIVVEGTQFYIYVNDVLYIDFDDTTRSFGGTKIGVGARTGASSNAVHRCYKLVAYAFDAPFAPSIIESGLADLPYRSISTMKWVKDLINNQPTVAQIREIVKTLDETFDLTHIELAIPLNIQQDYLDVGIVPGPYMSITTFFQVWCDEIHARGLNVMFRGAFNETELSSVTGLWNSILKVGVNRLDTGTTSSAPTDGQDTWLGRIYSLIVNNPSWFQDGDLWGPMPERTENNTRTRNVTSIERTGDIATITFGSNHDVGDGQPIKISGADQSDYNGSFIATKVSDTVLEITVANTPTTPATGTIVMTFGVSVFSDETSFISNEGSGVTTNFANFFIDVATVSANAFSLIGRNVEVGFTANNYSEINSGWIPQSLFNSAQKVVADHYGSTHEPFEMFSDIISAVNAKGYNFYHEEWSDYWNGALDDTARRNYLVNFYNMLVELKRMGIYKMLNYWGGWVGGVGEGILTDDGSFSNPDFGVNQFGLILAEYFNSEPEPLPTGPLGTYYGYYLNGVLLKKPKKFTREFIYQKTDYTTITGKTVRDTSSRKEKYNLGFENLTKTQVDAILTIIALNTPVLFTVNGKDIVNISETVIPYVGGIKYETPGGDYRASLELELIVEQPT